MRVITGTAALAAVLLLGGCSAATTDGDERLGVVASTDVYGSIAEAVGGEFVAVTSIIASPAQDPHSYEASAQDRLALSRAEVVIANGGGYDPFIDRLLDDGTAAAVITVVELAGSDRAANEHVWYDLDTVSMLAEQLAQTFSELDPGNASAYAANAEAFGAAIAELDGRVATLREELAGQGVVMTEPVPYYLLERAGLVDRTPPDFTEAVEEGADVPPMALRDLLEVIERGELVLLAYNAQTSSAETERVREAAEAAGIPVVSFAETLPDGEDFLSWMTANLERIAGAV